MADYYIPEQLALKLGISVGVIAHLESKGLLQPKVRGGKQFFSSRQAHDLAVALRLTRKRKVSLEQALAEVEQLRACQASATGS